MSAKKKTPPKRNAAKAKPATTQRNLALPESPLGAAIRSAVPIDPALCYPSPLNPRKEKFDDDLTSLADTIAAKGILQPLALRPDKDGRYEIVWGERRWRATKLGIGDGRIAKDFKLPAFVGDYSDRDIRDAALIENIARRSLNPVDEAEAFEELHNAGRTNDEIGQIAGTSGSHVKRRRQLLRCVPEIQKRLRGGKIDIEMARAFALGDAKTQRDFIERATEYDWDAETIRGHMLSERFPVKRAAFPPHAYQGELLEDEETGEKFFADDKQAMRLQEAAIIARIKTLKTDWPWVDRLETGKRPHEYEIARKNDAEAGAVVYIDGAGALAVLAPALRPETAAKRLRERRKAEKITGGEAPAPLGDGTAAPQPARLMTAAQTVIVKRAKTQALRFGVAAQPKVAKAIVICSLLGAHNVRMASSVMLPEWTYDTPAIERAAQRLVMTPVAELIARKPVDLDPFDQRASFVEDEAQAAALFNGLIALEDNRLDKIFALLVSSLVGVNGHNGHSIGDDPFEIAMARSVNAAEQLLRYWQVSETYFQAMSQARLVGLAVANGLAGDAKMKKSELVKLMLAQPAEFWTPEKFIELGFLAERDMAGQMAIEASLARQPTATEQQAVDAMITDETDPPAADDTIEEAAE